MTNVSKLDNCGYQSPAINKARHAANCVLPVNSMVFPGGIRARKTTPQVSPKLEQSLTAMADMVTLLGLDKSQRVRMWAIFDRANVRFRDLLEDLLEVKIALRSAAQLPTVRTVHDESLIQAQALLLESLNDLRMETFQQMLAVLRPEQSRCLGVQFQELMQQVVGF